MSASGLRRTSLYLLSFSLAACGSGDHSALPTSPQAMKSVPMTGKPVPAEPVSSPVVPVPVTSQGSKPPGFEASFRVDPHPNADGIIVGDTPLSVEFDLCGSKSGDGKPLTYLYDWDMDHLADATGSGEDCRQQHSYTPRHHPNAAGHVVFESNVCVVSGNPNPEFRGPDTYFSCRKYTIDAAVVTCTKGTLFRSVSGSTVGASNDFPLSCGLAQNSPDVAYQFTAQATGTYTFDAIGSGYDTVLGVFDQCGGTEQACNDDTFGLQSQVKVRLRKGDTAIVVISGFAGSTGPYTVNATLGGN